MRTRPAAFFVAALCSLFILGAAETVVAAQYGALTVTYPKNLEDENKNAVTQPVLVEVYVILNAELRAERIEPLTKRLLAAENDTDKKLIQAEIDNVRNAVTLIVDTHAVTVGAYESLKLPYGDYEIQFTPINPPNRKPTIIRVSHQKNGTTVPIQVAPEGAIIGGGPSAAELLKMIQDQQKVIIMLNDRVNSLQEKLDKQEKKP